MKGCDIRGINQCTALQLLNSYLEHEVPQIVSVNGSLGLRDMSRTWLHNNNNYSEKYSYL